MRKDTGSPHVFTFQSSGAWKQSYKTPTLNDVRWTFGGVALLVFAKDRYNSSFIYVATRQLMSSSLDDRDALCVQKIVSQPCSVQKSETKS